MIGYASVNPTVNASYRRVLTGPGTSGRPGLYVEDRVWAAEKYIAGPTGNAEIGYDTAPYIRATSGTFRLRNTANTDIALLSSGRFQTAGSVWNGAHLGIGNFGLWYDSNSRLRTTSGTPQSADGG